MQSTQTTANNMEPHNVIEPVECDIFIHLIREFQVHEIGSSQWLEAHEALIKFNQQAIVEAAAYREEIVKELFIAHDKLSALVHEAYCILVWRTKILPKLQAADDISSASFMLYTIVYHEAMAIAMLETLLYHENGCVALGGRIIDLIDYCAQAVVQLIGLTHMRHTSDRQDAQQLLAECAGHELQRQQKDLSFTIGLKCLTLLSFIVDRADSLTIAIIRRLVVTHDVPCLLSEILHCKPWLRNVNGVEKFVDGKWIRCGRDDDLSKVTKAEAHVWFGLRNILCNADAMRAYEWNACRQREIAKCQLLMTVDLLDQLPPLVDLKHRLCALTVQTGAAKAANILLEEMPQIKENLLREAKAMGIAEIVRMHTDRFVRIDGEQLVALAKRLNNVYNIDAYEQFCDEANEPAANSERVCAVCCTATEKKCSRCERTFYCSRECQVKHWPSHRANCQC